MSAKGKRHRLMLAMKAVRHAKEAVTQCLAEEWPAGGIVRWVRGRSDEVQTGTVLACGRETLFIRSRTGREYRISAYDVLRADPEEKEALFDRAR